MALEAVTLGGVGLCGLRPPQRQCVPRALPASSPSSSSQPSAVSMRCRARPRAVLASGAAAAAAAASASKSVERDVALESQAGVSYESLRDALAAGEWEAADAETRRLLCVLAGDGAAKRKWVYYSEVQFIPTADLQTMDRLWRAYSDGKFGYSVQRRIWKGVNGSWTAYFAKVGWTRPMPDSRNDAYKKFPLEFSWDVADPTPRGHLPLTNALRGTQLLEKLLSHPALDFAGDEEEELLLSDADGPAVLQPPQQQQQQQSSSKQQVFSDEDLTVDYGF